MFLAKSPCKFPRVLDFESCPPEGLEHYASDYPIYYDALYFPNDHSHVFSTTENICTWLSSLLSSMSLQYFSGEKHMFDVQAHDDLFVVTDCKMLHSIHLSSSDIASHSFHPYCVYKCLLSWSEPSLNPVW